MKLSAHAVLSTLLLVLVQAEQNEHHVHLRRQVAPTVAAPPLATYTGIPPLSSITLGMATRPPPRFTATYTPGATPPISGAPVLPTSLALTGWPPADKVPNTNSPEVQAWMKELDGITIPDIPPTKDSSCAADPAAAADAANRGWWTCGGYTRSTDIVACPDKLDWGVSFDDGPSPYSMNLLAKLKEKNIRATFFVVGSRVIGRPGMLIEEYMSGHEISVHTWSHPSLTTLTNAQIVAELGWTRMAIKTVLGVTPTTMRPPKGDIDDRVRAISLAMGMVPILWTSTPDGGKFDSNDWRAAGGLVTGPQAFTIFEDMMHNATTLNTGFITLQHDLYEITVDLAIGYTLEAALSYEPKFVLQPIGECLGMPKGNLYRETNTLNASPPLTADSADVGVDGKVDTTNPGTNLAFANAVPFLTSLSGLAIIIMFL